MVTFYVMIQYTLPPVIVIPIYIIGIAITGGSVGNSSVGVGTDDITANNVLDDNSVIYLNGDEESNGILFRCVTGLGPANGNTNDDIGDLYFNDTPLTKGMCNGFLQVKGELLADYPGVLNVLLCGNLTTSTEGVYTCRLMNSNMVYQNMSVGLYFSGRSKSHYVDGERFAELNIRNFNAIKIFTENVLHCLGHKYSLISIIKERYLYSRKNVRGTENH